MKQSIIVAALTLVMFLTAVFSIQYTPIKRAETFGAKIKTFFGTSPKDIATFVVMLITMAAVSTMLELFYDGNSILFNAKRIVLVALLWIAAYFDFKSCRIPNKLILLGLSLRVIVFMLELVFDREEILYRAISDIVGAAILLVMSFVGMLIVKNGLGMGDAKLFLIIGLFLGLQGSLVAVFISLIVTFFVSAYLLIRKKKRRKDSMPFAPTILAGTMVAVSIFGA